MKNVIKFLGEQKIALKFFRNLLEEYQKRFGFWDEEYWIELVENLFYHRMLPTQFAQFVTKR